jgi:hypothetical protein
MRAISAILLLAALPACAQPDSLEKGIAEFHRGEYAAAQASLEKAADSPQRRAFLAPPYRSVLWRRDITTKHSRSWCA